MGALRLCLNVVGSGVVDCGSSQPSGVVVVVVVLLPPSILDRSNW